MCVTLYFTAKWGVEPRLLPLRRRVHDLCEDVPENSRKVGVMAPGQVKGIFQAGHMIHPDSSFNIEANLRQEAMRPGKSDVVDQNGDKLGVRVVVMCTHYEDGSIACHLREV